MQGLGFGGCWDVRLPVCLPVCLSEVGLQRDRWRVSGSHLSLRCWQVSLPTESQNTVTLALDKVSCGLASSFPLWLHLSPCPPYSLAPATSGFLTC